MPRRPPTPTLFPYTTLFRSQTSAGRHLLAHELTHTVQQQRGLPALSRAVDGGDSLDDARLESEAEAVASEITSEENERSEEHTSELQSRQYLVCRLLLEKKK